MYISIHNVESIKVLEAHELHEHETCVQTIQIVHCCKGNEIRETIVLSLFADDKENLSLELADHT